MKTKLPTTLTAGICAGFFVGALDFLELIAARQMFFDVREMALAGFYAIVSVAAFIIVAVLLFGVASHFKDALFDAIGFAKGGPWRVAGVASVLLGPNLFCLLRLSSGPQASRIPGRLFWAFALAAVSSIAIAVGIERLADTIRRTRRRHTAAIVASLFAAVVVHRIDTTVLVRLYPLFHYGLSGLAIALAGAGFFLSVPAIRRDAVKRALVGGAIFLVLSGVYGTYKIMGTQNIRYVISQETGTATDLVRGFQALLSPSDEPSKVVDDTPAPSAEPILPTISRPGADLFLVTVDALRYDRLERIGAQRQVMPNLDAFAEKSVLFTRGYSPIPHTSYAITSLLTGKYTRPLFEVPGAPAVHETWPEILRRFRYETSAFFPPAVFFIDRARFLPYYQKGVGFLYKHVDARVSAQEKVSLLIEHVRQKKATGHPHFSWIHFFEAHEPYDPECTRLGDTPMDRYDCELSTVDTALETLFEFIENEDPDALVIVTSDHGEAFGEHGDNYHGTSLYDEQVRVPILVRIPGIAPSVVDAPVNLVDLLGTVTRVLDIPTPARVRSRNLTPLLAGDTLKMDAFSEVHDETMVVYDGYKLICDTTAALCRLYDLKADPHETRSIAEQQPERVRKLRKRLRGWMASHAHFELRPITDAEGAPADEAWPEAIQQALSGNPTAVDGLAAIVHGDSAPLVRQKASELLFRMTDTVPEALKADDTDEDPIVAAWMAALKVKAGESITGDRLAEIGEDLPTDSDAARTVTLSRLMLDDRRVIRDAVHIAIDESAPMETRQEALTLLTKLPRGTVTSEKLIPLLNTYQLTLEVAALFGWHESKAAVDPLVTRLKRERFPERKAALIDALAEIRDWRAVAAIADHLYLDRPPKNVLSGLERMVHQSPFGRRLPSDHPHGETFFYTRPKDKELMLYIKNIQKIAIKTTTESDNKTLKVFCNGVLLESNALLHGSNETVLESAGCGEASPSGAFRLEMEMVPDWQGTTVDSLLVLGKSLKGDS